MFTLISITHSDIELCHLYQTIEPTYNLLRAVIPPGLYEGDLHAVRDGADVFGAELRGRTKYGHHPFLCKDYNVPRNSTLLLT